LESFRQAQRLAAIRRFADDSVLSGIRNGLSVWEVRKIRILIVNLFPGHLGYHGGAPNTYWSADARVATEWRQDASSPKGGKGSKYGFRSPMPVLNARGNSRFDTNPRTPAVKGDSAGRG